MTAPAAPRMSTELRVWCFPMMALRTRSNSAKRSCTSGRRFCRLSVKGDARVGESNRQHTSVKFKNYESHSDLEIGLRHMYFWNSFGFCRGTGCFLLCLRVRLPPPPRTGDVSCGGVRVAQLVVAPCLSRTLLCFLLWRGVRAHRKRSAHDSRSFLARLRRVPVRNARIPMGLFSVHSRGTPSLLQRHS